MRIFIKILILTNTIGGWLVFLTTLGMVTVKMNNPHLGLIVLIPIIIMINFANYCFNNYEEPQKQIIDFQPTKLINCEDKS